MIQSLRKRFSYGNVMATIAVFLVLGGGAAVAAGLKKNSVTTKAIKNGAVTTAKLKNDAVTGAKANESTFGIVPLAARADVATTADKALKADSATTATTAASATKAETAVKAETATKADEAELFSGRQVSEVRSGATADTEEDSVNLTEGGVVVLSLQATVTAASDLLANASVRVVNNGAAQGFVECQIENEGDGSFDAMSQIGAQTVPAGHTITMPLTGFVDDLPSKGLVDPETVRVVCNENVGGNFAFESGDLNVTRIPVG